MDNLLTCVTFPWLNVFVGNVQNEWRDTSEQQPLNQIRNNTSQQQMRVVKSIFTWTYAQGIHSEMTVSQCMSTLPVFHQYWCGFHSVVMSLKYLVLSRVITKCTTSSYAVQLTSAWNFLWGIFLLTDFHSGTFILISLSFGFCYFLKWNFNFILITSSLFCASNV